MMREAAAPRRWMWTRPLRIHLSVVIVILLMLIAVPLIWLSYEQGVRFSTTAAQQQMTLLGRRAVERYRTVLGDGLSSASMVAASMAFSSTPPADLDQKTLLLRKALDTSPFIDSIFAGYPDGSFVQLVSMVTSPDWAKGMSMPEGTAYTLRIIEATAGRREFLWRFLDEDGRFLSERRTGRSTYDPRRRPWYKDASGGSDPVAVGPYVMATTRSLGLTIAAPMDMNSSIVIGADMLLSTLSRLLARDAVSKNAMGYVFDANDRLIIHSDPVRMEKLKDRLLQTGRVAGGSLDDPVLERVQDLLDSEDARDGTLRFDIAGNPYLAQLLRLERDSVSGGDTVVIVAPLADFTQDSERLLRNSMLFSAVLLTAGILAALLISRLISRSLTFLTVDARRMGDLELGEAKVVHSYITEINALARALETARGAILTFAVFVPRELVRRIVASGQAVVNSADRLEVTVLFTDIRDFTGISETSSPEEVVALLSTYFQVMNDVVEQHRGVILQYLGDSINAIWNAPTPNAAHAADACRCALALKTAIERLNAANVAAGKPALATRFGLHTGEAVVGTVGARSRLQYTAMGDTVNVASRLEGANKQFGTSILVSRAVVDQAGPACRFRALGLAEVKGRKEAVEVFELLDMARDVEAR